MSFLIPAIVLVVAGLTGAFAFAFRQIASPDSKSPVTGEWLDSMSVERYKPMLRLLSNDDLAFLKMQPGFRRQMISRLRRQRCGIFKGYLRNLSTDFRRTCSALRLVMLHAQVDRPDLAALLLRTQASFALGLLQIHCRLFFYRLGVASVDASGLIKLFDGMQIELRTFVLQLQA